jgi:hypothetical protein
VWFGGDEFYYEGVGVGQVGGVVVGAAGVGVGLEEQEGPAVGGASAARASTWPGGPAI